MSYRQHSKRTSSRFLRSKQNEMRLRRIVIGLLLSSMRSSFFKTSSLQPNGPEGRKAVHKLT